MNKIMTIKEATKWKNRLVVTNGCFDILHRGHVEYLLKAKELGKFLFVLLNSDESIRQLKGPNRPINNQDDRAFVLACLSCVDGVVIFNGTNCAKELKILQPEVYVKGGDYNIDTLNPEERKVLQQCGTRIEFIPFIANYSTTNILKTTFQMGKSLQKKQCCLIVLKQKWMKVSSLNM